jgi:ATP-dependent RNA helicase DeaD
MLTFNDMGLSPELLKGVEDLGFVKPTTIQQEIIPLFFESDNDIVGLAQTGTGKTAAFGFPIINEIDVSDKVVQALVLSPTRELCVQITKDFQSYAKHIKGLSIVPVYGGSDINTQIRAIKRGAQIIVATPGRMLDLIRRKAANLSSIKTVVLDEADEMLNMGFREELDGILSETPEGKRTLLFSATMPKEVARIAKNYMHNPKEVKVGKENAGAENVNHIYYQVHARDRYLALKRIADINPKIFSIVFCRTRMETKEVADKLIRDGYNADAIHGDLSQAQRDQVMKRFRDRSLQMLVATDVAARGIDVDNVTHVINYNLPDDLFSYTHRSGRTGRADKKGTSIIIVNYREKNRIPHIERIIGKKVEKVQIPSGAEVCEKQLFHLIDKMENVEVDEDQIAPFMDAVNKKLEWLDKEDLIKRFVSLEFNRFIEYYKNARDLNEKAASGEGRERGGRRGGLERGGREKGGSQRFERGGRRKRGGAGYARLFMNVGKKDGIFPAKIIGMINDRTDDRDINIGSIDLKDSFSFFEVDKNSTEKVLKAFKDFKFKGRDIRVDVADGDAGGSDGSSSGGGNRRKKNGGVGGYGKKKGNRRKR